MKVRLAAPRGIDLLLRSLSEARPDQNGLEASFTISARDIDFARRLLDGPLTAALLELAKAYNHVELYTCTDGVGDNYIEFGPLNRRPEETAADLSAVIEALLTLTPN